VSIIVDRVFLVSAKIDAKALPATPPGHMTLAALLKSIGSIPVYFLLRNISFA
jgi:hypothetical protein